jgi:predicted DNA-binding transcriptional regulator AlpA
MLHNQQKQIPPGRAIRIPEVCRLTGVSRATIWRLIDRDPTFPRPFYLSSAITVWDEAEVFSWIGAKKNGQRATGLGGEGSQHGPDAAA